MVDIAIRPCKDYSEESALKALEGVLEPLGGLNWVKEGMRIAVKANLVGPFKPESAAVTHPSLLAALTKLLVARGAEVTVGDSPGGIYSKTYLDRVYAVSGMKAVEVNGGKLNYNFNVAEADFPDAAVLRHFTYTAWLDEADAIINFCKLKVHGMMGLSAAVKNLYGTIPGTFKVEYHYKYSNHDDFGGMLVDLNEYFKPRLSIADAVVAMEGNGPTAGTPRQVGAVLASTSPYKLDLGCSGLIGLDKDSIPYLKAAYERGLMPSDYTKLVIDGDFNGFIVNDFKNVAVRREITFFKGGKAGALISKAASAMMRSSPRLERDSCVGCGVCMSVCPAKAISMKDKKARINKKTCIRCFCCQEFCPKGAMKVHRPAVARYIGRL
jgi:uncharacterized protein (DUF362 family)/Pyruvate/2-oxoacid:ferredoxin oxidoreductase delta subunit